MSRKEPPLTRNTEPAICTVLLDEFAAHALSGMLARGFSPNEATSVAYEIAEKLYHERTRFINSRRAKNTSTHEG